MPPRPYAMDKRTELERQTRQRIIEATASLHAERGILATRPADVAARANVALTTFYKHFPSRSELVQACTAHAGSLVAPPDVSAVAEIAAPAARIAAMVKALFDFYAAREPFLYTGRTEERAVPELEPVMKRLGVLRNALVQAALGDLNLGEESGAAAAALMDFWSWRLLRRDLGLDQTRAIEAAASTLCRIADVPTRRPRRR